jgi:MFS family permease
MGRRPVALLPGMIALAALGNLLLAFLPGAMLRHLLSGLIYGGGYGMVHTLLFTSVMETTPPERRGAAVGALFFAFDAATALGSLSLGWVMEHGGFRRGWAMGALLLTLAIPAARRLVKPRKPHLVIGETQHEEQETADDADDAEKDSGPQIPPIHTD